MRMRIAVKAMALPSTSSCTTSSESDGVFYNVRPGIRRQYVRYTRLSFGEDRMHEFKCHRNLASEDVPYRSLHSRKPVSRNINGFLNTGQGGKIYLGVLDDGVVVGLALSDAQKDHVRISLEDLMGRYSPPVPSSRYRLAFVPVINLDTSRERDSGVGGSEEELNISLTGEKMRGHLLRTARYCWCDKETKELMMQGVSIPYYVIEISILPFICDPILPLMVLQLYPIYQNEQGHCYFRGSTSLQEYSYRQIAELTIDEVDTHFTKIKKKLRCEVKEYMTKVTYALVNLAAARQQSHDNHVTGN